MPEPADSAPSLSAGLPHISPKGTMLRHELKGALIMRNDPIGPGAWRGLRLSCLGARQESN